jgi:hypothetical protein
MDGDEGTDSLTDVDQIIFGSNQIFGATSRCWIAR